MGDERRWAVLLPAWDPVLGQLGPRTGAAGSPRQPDAMLPLQAAPSLELQCRLIISHLLAALLIEKGLLAHRVWP